MAIGAHLVEPRRCRSVEACLGIGFCNLGHAHEVAEFGSGFSQIRGEFEMKQVAAANELVDLVLYLLRQLEQKALTVARNPFVRQYGNDP